MHSIVRTTICTLYIIAYMSFMSSFALFLTILYFSESKKVDVFISNSNEVYGIVTMNPIR